MHTSLFRLHAPLLRPATSVCAHVQGRRCRCHLMMQRRALTILQPPSTICCLLLSLGVCQCCVLDCSCACAITTPATSAMQRRQRRQRQQTCLLLIDRLFPRIFSPAAAVLSESAFLQPQTAVCCQTSYGFSSSLFILPLIPAFYTLRMYNAATDWGRDVGGGVGAFLERVITPVLKAQCLRVQVVVCSDVGAAAVAAVVACLEGGGLIEWARGEGNIVNAAQLCSNSTCACCSSIPPHHLDFALLSRCHWALISNSTFGIAARM